MGGGRFIGKSDGSVEIGNQKTMEDQQVIKTSFQKPFNLSGTSIHHGKASTHLSHINKIYAININYIRWKK
jgi:hypothetical protein